MLNSVGERTLVNFNIKVLFSLNEFRIVTLDAVNKC